MKALKKMAVKKTVNAKKDVADSYNRFKSYQGKQYTGMAIGRSHKWYYDKGIWLDKKITPEKWMINFEVIKRRAGKAPKGSGAPVGTEYHWYILAHQIVKKLDENSYSTSMNGLKYKLAHKRSDKDKWNISDKTQRDHLVKFLKEFIRELEEETPEEFAAHEQNEVKPVKRKAVKKFTDRLAKPAKKRVVKSKKATA